MQRKKGHVNDIHFSAFEQHKSHFSDSGISVIAEE